jgi:hypothetical protein
MSGCGQCAGLSIICVVKRRVAHPTRLGVSLAQCTQARHHGRYVQEISARSPRLREGTTPGAAPHRDRGVHPARGQAEGHRITRLNGRPQAAALICHSDVSRISSPLTFQPCETAKPSALSAAKPRKRGLHQDAAQAAQAQAPRRRRGPGRRKGIGAAGRLVPRLLAAGLRCPPVDGI